MITLKLVTIGYFSISTTELKMQRLFYECGSIILIECDNIDGGESQSLQTGITSTTITRTLVLYYSIFSEEVSGHMLSG